MWDHDRTLKIVDRLTTSIFSHEIARLTRREIELVRENARMGGAADGFFYRGILYSDLDPAVRAQGEKGNLNANLHLAMDDHLRDKGVVEFDRHRVRQALTLILQDTRSDQDVRDALPNALKDALPELQGLSRTRPEAYTVQGNPRAERQYQKLREKLEFYNAAKLIY
jgi:hypothetical protein